MKVGVQDVQGLGSTFGKDNPEPSSHEPPTMEPGTCHTDYWLKNKRGKIGGKYTVQRLNEVSGCQEHDGA